jgi:hypothetical protein
MFRKALVFVFILVFSVELSFSQAKEEDEEFKLDTKTLSYGLSHNTFSGLIAGGVLRNSFPVSIRNNKPVYRYLALELINIKNPRESTTLSVFGSRYVYGKENYLFSIRPEYGREFTLFKKDGENGVGLNWIVAAGPSIGLEKPYYIKYASKAGESPQTVAFNPDIHKNTQNITGSGNIFQGLFKDLRFNPGLHLKVSTAIDMNTFQDKVTGIEVGTTMELFFKEPNILADKFATNQRFYPSLYLTLYFGNKKLVKKIEKLNDLTDRKTK